MRSTIVVGGLIAGVSIGHDLPAHAAEKQRLIPITPQKLAIDKQREICVRLEQIHQALREYADIQDHAFSKQFLLRVAVTDQLQEFWTSVA